MAENEPTLADALTADAMLIMAQNADRLARLRYGFGWCHEGGPCHGWALTAAGVRCAFCGRVPVE